jgi:hypothetical protein
MHRLRLVMDNWIKDICPKPKDFFIDYMIGLCKKTEECTVLPEKNMITKYHSVTVPVMTLRSYITHLSMHIPFSSEHYIRALFLIKLIVATDKRIKMDPLQCHRLVITCLAYVSLTPGVDYRVEDVKNSHKKRLIASAEYDRITDVGGLNDIRTELYTLLIDIEKYNPPKLHQTDLLNKLQQITS